MQKNIHYYEKLIQEKRKKTPWREFLMELGSWEWLNLYKKDGKICRYPDTGRVKVLDDENFLNAWAYFIEYDHEKSFFQNFQYFHDIFPFQHMFHIMDNENSEYTDCAFGTKNTYLSFIIGFNAENVCYSALCYVNVHNIFNSCLACNNSSNIYSSAWITDSHNIFYSRFISDSSNIWFSANLMGCEECIGCDGLQNQRYNIGNIAYSKKEYEKKKEQILKDKKWFWRYYKHILKKKWINFASENVKWEYIIKSSNIKNGGWVVNMHNCRNVLIGNGDKWSQNLYDWFDVGINGTDFYGVMWAGWSQTTQLYCSLQITGSSFIYYSYFLENCHHCLGCIWLKNKSYCILNKQYTKEEWEILAEKIFASMEADETLGEFFPASMNPFYFNDTLAYLIDDSFTKEEVEKDGYLWRDEPIKADIPEGMRVVKNTELDQFQGFRRIRHPERSEWSRNRRRILDSSQAQNDETEEWYINPEILNVVILDEKWNYYRIVKMEYNFLMKHGLPLPTIHWLDRMKMGFR